MRRYWQVMSLDQHRHSRCMACLCKQVTTEGPGPSGTGAKLALEETPGLACISKVIRRQECFFNKGKGTKQTQRCWCRASPPQSTLTADRALEPCLPLILAGTRLLRRGCARCIIIMHWNTKEWSDRAQLEGVHPLRLRCRKYYVMLKEGRLLRTPPNTL